MFPFLRILGLSWIRYLLLSYFSTYACGTLRMQIGSSVTTDTDTDVDAPESAD